ncbi:hypothetical protein B0I35DRAFT_510300 [Stachybotrys elegans]|uniref:CFEM domain-containing protein n=1 Tax=Stachybotrys elegans TaxID=80388 RepID=A0A8K0WV03_9HYPO|nr:hypothetical protein B0I35DRAFT_510300 [Stachybotrys elegans]
MRLLVCLLAGAAILANAQQPDLLSALGQFPNCSTPCIFAGMENLDCGLTDAACVCADKTFADSVRACITESCSIEDSLHAARIEADACNRPRRNRKKDVLLALILEVPAFLAPIGHIYSRSSTVTKFAVDDYLFIASWLSFGVLVVLAQWTSYLAFGVDTWYVETDVMTRALQMFFVLETIYLTLLCFTKLAVLTFYMRIFPQRWFKLAARITMALIIITTIAYIFAQIFQCRPIRFTWEGWMSDDREARCVDITTLTWSAGAFNIFYDTVILILPLPLILGLKMKPKTKIGITFMFSLGIFVLVTSCVRLSYVLGFGHTFNPSWDYVDTIMWTGLEVSTSLIVACLPAIRLLLNRVGFFGALFGSLVGRTTGLASSSNIKTPLHDRSTHRSEYEAMNESQIELGPQVPPKDTEIKGYGPRAASNMPSGHRIHVTTTTTVEHHDGPR